jgi:hypothetical protein
MYEKHSVGVCEGALVYGLGTKRGSMKALRGGFALAALILSAPVLQAQQPDSDASKERAPGMMMNQGMRQMVMDSMNARLDTLLGRMNRAKGNAKVTAMAQVINELVAQRKAMQGHMRQMMQRHRGMMEMEIDSAAADTAAHAEHHPQ